MIEKWWDLLKHGAIPEEVGAQTSLMNEYALALLWRCYANGDPVDDLGEAVRCYMQKYDFDTKKMKELRGAAGGKNVKDEEEHAEEGEEEHADEGEDPDA